MSTPAHRARLVLHLRGQGITDTDVLAAIERVPRDLFVPDAFKDQAWEDMALPIGHGQTLSQPYVVARMAEALQLDPRHKVLEVGTGSGYHAAVLAQLCRRVYTIERHRPLSVEAERRFKALRLYNITVLVGDGMKGWPQQAPFDRISVTAAAVEPPPALLEQLGAGGVMVMPVGGHDGTQDLMRYRRGPDGDIADEKLLAVRFVPLLPGIAQGSAGH
ncbi:MAG: protein-L-isoaspartate(D-aspartate) O-methyltransferase [Alphaproteobacteria bacterium]|nr:protein-L-isoaspartate(D-aspartate) O-methyltransferase [Alphaproteobacteria bacterium]